MRHCLVNNEPWASQKSGAVEGSRLLTKFGMLTVTSAVEFFHCRQRDIIITNAIFSFPKLDVKYHHNIDTWSFFLTPPRPRLAVQCLSKNWARSVCDRFALKEIRATDPRIEEELLTNSIVRPLRGAVIRVPRYERVQIPSGIPQNVKQMTAGACGIHD